VKPWLCAAATALICSAAPAKDDLKLLVWINGDKGYNGLQRVGDAFEKLSGVRVEVQHPEGAPEKFQQAAGAGKGPDIFCWPHDRVGEWAKAGLIVPVRPPKAIRDEIEATSWEAFRYRGRLWGYPIGIEANGLIYNKALVPQPPATFDELISIDARLSQQGKKAVLWDFNKSFFTWPMLAGAGGFVFGKDALGDYDARQVGVNQAGAVQGAEMLQRMVQLGVMPKGARYAEMEAGLRAARWR
jgi:maltose/maltodextrin transport system substrate-binding protein